MAKIIKATFITNICNAYLFFMEQFSRMSQSVFINEAGKGFSRYFFEIAAKGGVGHANFLADLIKA